MRGYRRHRLQKVTVGGYRQRSCNPSARSQSTVYLRRARSQLHRRLNPHFISVSGRLIQRSPCSFRQITPWRSTQSISSNLLTVRHHLVFARFERGHCEPPLPRRCSPTDFTSSTPWPCCRSIFHSQSGHQRQLLEPERFVVGIFQLPSQSILTRSDQSGLSTGMP